MTAPTFLRGCAIGTWPGVVDAPTSTSEPAPAAQLAPAARSGWGAGRIVLVGVGSLFALVLVATAIFVAIFPVHLSQGVGEKSFTPTTAADVNRSYRLGIGEMNVDLTQLRLPAGETHVKARVDYGDLNVVVPSGVAVRAYAKSRLGYVSVFGDEADGRNADESVTADGRRVLVVDARVQVGSVRIERTVR